MVSPRGEGLLDERTVEGMHGYPFIPSQRANRRTVLCAYTARLCT